MIQRALMSLVLIPFNVSATGIAEADRGFDINPAPAELRGKAAPIPGKASESRYTDATGLYTFVMPRDWRMEVIPDEPPGMAFSGIHGKHPVTCVVYGQDYRRGPRTLSELQALPEATARAAVEPTLVADTGWKTVEKRDSLNLGDGAAGKPVKAWTWASPAPDGKAYDTVAVVEAPAALLVVLCGSSPQGQAATEEVIRNQFRLAEGALVAPAARSSIVSSPKEAEPKPRSPHKRSFQEAMRVWGQGDYATALTLLTPLAEQGYAPAQNNLGVMYEKGYSVPKNDAEAARWYRKAAEQGDAKAQFSLAVMHANGRGVEKSIEEALAWYRKSAEQGYARAQTNLGLMHSKGEGVTKDATEAVRWYRRAAEQGNATAQNNLGLKLLAGHGVSRDPVAAAMWLVLATEAGDKNAPVSLTKLEQQLGAEKMAQVRQRASECRSRSFQQCE